MKSDLENRELRALGDLDAATFREWGYHIVDWIADYLEHPEKYPVLAQVEPGAIRSQLPPFPPDNPEPMAAIIDDVHKLVVPGLTHWNHPAFMAYFGTTGSAPGILGELFSAAFNVNAMLWKTSPAATELEEVVLDWLRQMIGLPAGFSGIIYDTASVSTMHAIAAAREAVPGLNSRELGLSGRPDAARLRLYMSEQAHSSVEKGAITLGIGQAGVRKIPVDSEFRMESAALEQAIQEDLKVGWTPFCVVATVGTTSTTSIDPVPQIADICRKYNIWLHVDAAYGGAAAILPEMRWVLEGCDRADSLVVNPHKWIFTPMDLSAFYTRRMNILKQAFSLVPEYLKTGQDASVHNLMDYGVQLGRRFRALKLWMIIRTFGRDGIAARIREHMRLAQLVSGWIDEHPAFERLAPVRFSTVCFCAVPREGEDADKLNEALLNAVNATGELFLSHTRLHDRFTIRMAIGNIRTNEHVVRRAWELLKANLEKIRQVSGR
ncbi:MAG: aminotransferase class V-fold PLP-dependent enzyme [Acidobacteria bacterium]|nr:MAG: aminotransferase class V-fold PLP-dependent enzyme [Acidobacteriota bacterium]